MKILSTIAVFACFTHFSHSQSAQINIEQDQKIDQLLEVYKSSLSNNEYYRIQVGFGNYAKAQKIKSNVEEDFPDLPSKIDFDSPTYRVRVGRFTSRLNAERKFNEVRIKYPDAMLLKPKKSTK
ncbi:SPOR domain-containing protein [Maribacter ulvicola]|uniref:Sporulation related domain-containing protein n=1 Tax=Maribacter ulvicola TaxID=228959 RepID=A0A1N6R363_9FLAO|nr:SPOR domain-containing protein [Maribacter ulvicola]SIQ23284.1 Sporulation related domain-containing protein [Maribacter ulvicola]